MQFLRGLKDRDWGNPLEEEPECLSGRKSFEQIVNLFG